MASLVSGGTLLEVKPSPQVIVRLPVTALAMTADPTSVFVGEDVAVEVTLWDAGDGTDSKGQALGPMVINLDDGDAGGTFGEAMLTIGNGGHSASTIYSNDSAAEATLTATAADEALGLDAVTADVTVKSGITAKTAKPDPASAGADLDIFATGEADAAATLRLSYVNADGNTVTIKKGLDPFGDPVDGSQVYFRTITLPADIPEAKDGEVHTVTLTIAGRQDTVTFEVINDQAPPMLSDASAKPVQAEYAMDGNQVVLSVKVTMNESGIGIDKVVANTADLDSENPEIELEDSDGDGVYDKIFTISSVGNTNGDGEKTVSFTATDDLENTSEAATASIRLRNDTEAPMLSMATAMPASAKTGDPIAISVMVMDESGIESVTADASSIGGGMVALNAPMMTANGNGNGMDANGMTANGNGNGMDANGNGNGNGMDANGNGNGNGMDANGMTNGMGANGMDANGAVMYSGTATVGDVDDDDYMISITATDTSGNPSDPVSTNAITIDNTGPMLVASVDPDMAKDGDPVIISVTSETGLTDVTADASAIGGDAAVSASSVD